MIAKIIIVFFIFIQDRFPNASNEEKLKAEENFKTIGEAYAVLSDATKRNRFDNLYDSEDDY